MGRTRPAWTAAGWVGSRQQALQPLAPRRRGRRGLSSGGASGETRRLGWGAGGRSPGPIDSRTMEGPARASSSGKGDFVSSLLLLPRVGSDLFSLPGEAGEAHEGTGPHPHLAVPGPGSRTSTSASRCPVGPGGKWGGLLQPGRRLRSARVHAHCHSHPSGHTSSRRLPTTALTAGRAQDHPPHEVEVPPAASTQHPASWD